MKNKILYTVSIMAMLALFGCGDDSSSGASDAAKKDGDSVESADETTSQLYVFGSDFQSGELRWREDGGISEDYLSYHQDSKIVAVGSNLYVLEGAGADNVSLLDPTTNKVKWQTSLEDYSNPRDIVKLGDKLWVALEGAESFVQISSKDGKVKKTVKTNAFTSKGGTSPNLVDFETSGDTLFALFQRYVYDAETYTSTYPVGLLALYSEGGDLLDTIPLKTRNPMQMKMLDGELYVATQGEYNEFFGTDADSNRGIEKVNLKEKKSELWMSGKKLGGGVAAMVADSVRGNLYVAVYKNWGEVPVVKVNVKKASVETIEGVEDAEGSLAFDAVQGVLYVGDRSKCLLVYNGSTINCVECASNDALLPYGIALVEGAKP
ncbi:MAG: hypothetical protein MJY82_01920 [Fibrobacter sp.]|nr:hypothetical protein [Fibrobacter sp.]